MTVQELIEKLSSLTAEEKELPVCYIDSDDYMFDVYNVYFDDADDNRHIIVLDQKHAWD